MIKGFLPIIGKDARVLILGSMPSVTSLNKQEYYGFKQNRFWKIIGAYFNQEFTSYEQKVKCIEEHHIILWDVISMCDREGSLDSSIKNEEINDIVQLLDKHKSVECIICNGKKSYDLFKKHFKDINIDCIYLPSTSGANQTIKKEKLFQMWFDTFHKYNLNV